MPQNISDERKVAFYVGTGLMILGGILFGSIFLSRHGSSFEGRAIGGMALLIIGKAIRGIGARGLAGSGVILNPEKAREELEPYSRMAGGMVKDALDEADVHFGSKSEKVIMIKCSSCGKLNEEDSKFCQECGNQI